MELHKLVCLDSWDSCASNEPRCRLFICDLSPHSSVVAKKLITQLCAAPCWHYLYSWPSSSQWQKCFRSLWVTSGSSSTIHTRYGTSQEYFQYTLLFPQWQDTESHPDHIPRRPWHFLPNTLIVAFPRWCHPISPSALPDECWLSKTNTQTGQIHLSSLKMRMVGAPAPAACSCDVSLLMVCDEVYVVPCWAPIIHRFCDSVSYPGVNGKVSILKVLLGSGMPGLNTVHGEPGATHSDLKHAGTVCLSLYGMKKAKSMNNACYQVQHYRPEEKKKHQCLKIFLQLMPTHDAAHNSVIISRSCCGRLQIRGSHLQRQETSLNLDWMPASSETVVAMVQAKARKWGGWRTWGER